MIILISLILLVGLGIFLIYGSYNGGFLEVLGVILAGLSAMVLIIALLALVTDPIKTKGDISKFLVTKATVEDARKNGISTENVALQHKIIESNRWLAKYQYYNTTIFGLWVPDEIDNLKPMR